MSNVTTLNVSGLHCASCSMLIEMTLGDVPGVESVKCSHATGETTVEFDATTVSLRQLKEAVQSAGYDVVNA
jgi:copper chaperone CopZ